MKGTFREPASAEGLFNAVHRGGIYDDGIYPLADFNDCTTAGLYSYVASARNKPPNTAYGILLVIISDSYYKSDYNWMWQIAFDTSFVVWMRLKINYADYTPWQRFVLQSA